MSDAMSPGTVVDGRYRIEREVAQGGFGTVYEALHVGLGAKVAMKIARVDHVSPRGLAQAVASFLEEGRVLKRLRHPNLVSALDVGVLPADARGIAIPYLVLDWCEGPTLREWLAHRGGASTPSDAWQLLRPVVDAIAHAHAEGVVHRDLKPANIVLETVRGVVTPRVIDFGIAKLLEPGDATSGATQTSAANAAHTPRYAAPEQLTGMRSGPRSDVYAIALVIAEVLRGRPVFETDDDARAAILDRDAVSRERLELGFAPWDDIVLRALSAHPAARPADAGALLRELDAATARSASASPPSASAAGARPYAADPDSNARVAGAMPTDATARRGASGGTGRTVAAVAGAIGVVGLLVAAGWFARVRSTSPTSGEVAQHDGVPSSSAGYAKGAAPLRPLRELPPAELLERAVAAGLRGCSSQPSPGHTGIVCTNGIVMRTDGKFGGPDDARTVRMNLQYQAKMYGRPYGAARFTTDDAAGLVVAGPSDIMDEVLARILDGVRHEAIGTEKAPPLEAPIPARLADWTGMTLAARAEAIGVDLTHASIHPMMSAIQGSVGLEYVTFQLTHADRDAWLAAAKKAGNPFAYATDGEVIVACFGTGDFATVAFVQKLLGPSKATRVEKGQIR